MEFSKTVVERLLGSYTRHGWLPTILVFILIPLGNSNFLLFHTLVELFAITIAIISAIVAWHTYALAKNQFLLLLGCGYCLIAGLDLAHMLSFQGMPFIIHNTGSTSLQFTSSAKLIEAALLFIAPFYLTLGFRPLNLVLLLSAIMLFLCWSIIQGWWPTLYVEFEGLTSFKIIFDYVAITLLLAALLSFWRVRHEIAMNNFILINSSIVLTILSSYAMTLYSDFGDATIIAGHILKLLSYWAIYAVLIESSLRQPFLNLARDANTYDAVPDETIVVDRAGNVRQINAAVRKQLVNHEAAIGSRCHLLQHDPDVAEEDCLVCRAIAAGKSISRRKLFIKRQRQWFEITLSPIGRGRRSLAMVHVRRNITIAKEAQTRSSLYNRLYSVLSYTNKVLAGAKSKQKMFSDICEVALHHGDFKMSWIGLIEDNSIKPQIHAGAEASFFAAMGVRVDDPVHASGPIAQAIQTNRVQCVNNVALDSTAPSWSGTTKQQGYRSLAAVPLSINAHVVGIYAIYSETPDAFDVKILSLLDSLGRDVSSAMERLQEREKQADAERKIHQLSQVVEQNSHAILITNTDFTIEYANKAFTLLTGYWLAEIIDKTPAILRCEYEDVSTYEAISRSLRKGLRWSGQIRQQRKDGTLYWSLQTIMPIKNDAGEITHFVSTSEDNTDLHDAQHTIEQLAFYDPLTNLPNRRLLSDRLHQALEHAQRSPDTRVAVMVFDLDNFKIVNDSLGHNYGDELLQQVAQILQSQVRTEDTVSRQGGDEFTIILAGMKNTRLVLRFILRMQKIVTSYCAMPIWLCMSPRMREKTTSSSLLLQ